MAHFIFYVVLCFFMIFSSEARAVEQESSPNLGGTRPVFVTLNANYNGSPQDKNTINFQFDPDWERCRSYYGPEVNWDTCSPSLGLSGKKVVVPMDPPLAGIWRWEGDYGLSFTPDSPWQAGQMYKVILDLEDLGAPARMVGLAGTRRIEPRIQAHFVTATIRDMTYLQDPSDPSRKLVTAQIETNYQVDPKNLKDHIRLILVTEPGSDTENRSAPLSFEFTPGTDKKSAAISVALKDLPEHDGAMEMTIDPGLIPLTGGAPSSSAFTERVRVPSLGTYLAVQDIIAAALRNDAGTPFHILSLSLNVKAAPEVVRAATKACLLPFYHPVMQKKDDQPYRWKADNEVTPQILEECEKVPLSAMPSTTGDTSQMGFGFEAPSGRFLYVEVDKGWSAFGGYTLERPLHRIVEIPDLPHDVSIVQEGAILPLTGAKTLLLKARGVDALNVEVAQIAPSALAHFVAQTEGDVQNPSFKSWSFDIQDVATIAQVQVPIAYKGPSIVQYAGFDLTPHLKNTTKGIFLLTIQGMRENKEVGEAEKRFVLVSDLGLMAKMSARGGGDVFVLSFAKGKPAAGAQVSVLGRSGIDIFTAQTDKEGHVSLPDLSAHTRDRAPVAIVAHLGEDYAFLPYDRSDRQMDLSRFDVSGAVPLREGLSALIFTDRGIYRPGETAQIGLLLRDDEGRASAKPSQKEGLPLTLTIYDPRNALVHEEIATFSPENQGFATTHLATQETWTTGSYTATLSITGQKGGTDTIGSATFSVQDFEPDKLKIQAGLTSTLKGWAHPQGLMVSVNLANLYGSPASERDISGSVYLQKATLSFEGFLDYAFFDPYPASERTIQYTLPRTKTEEDGSVQVPLLLEEQNLATYDLVLSIEGFEAGGGRSVAAHVQGFVSPMDFVLGYRSDATLSFLKKDAKTQINIIALDPDLAPIAPKDLKAQMVRVTHISSLVQSNDGTYTYESIPREEVIGNPTPFVLPIKGVDVSLPTAEVGEFIWQVIDAAGRTVLRVPFSVISEGTRSEGLDRQAVLHISTNKQNYDKGEEIEVSITAPYTGSGLVTLEGERVLAHKWFVAKGTDSVVRIAIPKNFSGKGYVNVAFVRSASSPEIFLSPLAYAVTSFTAGESERRLNFTLSAPDRVEQGQEIEITYTAPQKGKAIIYAADEGILQVANYQIPDPIWHFLLNRGLGVRTLQMLDLLMPDYALVRRLAAEGGDAADQMAIMTAHLNPFKRFDLAPAVYWSDVIDVGPEPQTLRFTPPQHFTGTMRLMAVGVDDDRIGNAQRSILVRGDVVVTPTVPAFVAPGDVVQGSITVNNGVKGSGADAKFALSFEATPGIALKDPLPTTLTVPEGAERSAPFTFTATQELGPAEVTLMAALGDKVSSKATMPLSVRPPVARETTFQAGFAPEGSATLSIVRELYTQGGPQQKLQASALPTAYIAGLSRYLEDFPYGCTEQITGQGFAHVILKTPDDVRTAGIVQEILQTLRGRQTYSGGFAYWDGHSTVSSFVSAYVLDFLLTAKSAGFAVPEDMIEQTLSYMRDFVNESVKDSADARLKAYGIYLLTRSGFVTTNEILHLRKYWEEEGGDTAWRADLGGLYIAASYKLMRQDDMAREVLAVFTKQGLTQNLWGDTFANSAIAHAQYVSILAQHFPEDFAKMDKDVIWRLAGFVSEGRYNTLTAAFGIRALTEYAQRQEELLESDPVHIIADGASLEAADIPLGTKVIDMRAPAHSPLFYTLTQSGFTKTGQDTPITSGLEISKIYKDIKDDAPVPLGSVIEVNITLRAQGEELVEDVAIIDLLPAGFALEPDGTDALPSTLDVQAIERRSDRIIVFANVEPGRDQIFSYRLRAVAVGDFITPAPYAQAMYNPTTQARGTQGRISVAHAP